MPAFLWDHISVKPGEDVCFIHDFDKIDICAQSFYDKLQEEDKPLSEMDLSSYEIRGL